MRNCPACEFEFKILAVNGLKLPALAPIVCERCGEVSLYVDGVVRVMSPAELDAVKRSPSWEFIDRVQKFIQQHNAERAN
jgi:hypothetical protein